eukprot:scaffold2761_cov148-Isochrysis_galbana.AAC.4
MAHSLIFGDNSTFRCHKAALPKFDDVDKLQLAPDGPKSQRPDCRIQCGGPPDILTAQDESYSTVSVAAEATEAGPEAGPGDSVVAITSACRGDDRKIGRACRPSRAAMRNAMRGRPVGSAPAALMTPWHSCRGARLFW